MSSAKPLIDSTPKVEVLFKEVVESEAFQSAPVTQRLLLFLWEHLGEQVNEYAIAVDALKRPSHFDPKIDATVRVQIARLRTKLEEFYEHRGQEFPLRLWIPVGGHELKWAYQPRQRSLLSSLAAMPSLYRRGFLVASLISTILAVLCLLLLLENRSLRASRPEDAAALPRFWHSFLMNGKPTVIVLPNVVHISWAEQGFGVMDLRVSEFSDWKNSPYLREMAQMWGQPVLNQTYVFARDAFASFDLQAYFRRYGQQVPVVEAPNYAFDSAANRNTIFLGLPQWSPQIRQVLVKTNFDLIGNMPNTVRNRNPHAGEAAEYPEAQLSPKRRICPGLIVYPPARPEGTRHLLLVGRWATALTSTLLSADGLRLIDQYWRNVGSPDAWEMVVMADIANDTTIVKVWPVACRAIPATFWK